MFCQDSLDIHSVHLYSIQRRYRYRKQLHKNDKSRLVVIFPTILSEIKFKLHFNYIRSFGVIF